MPEHSSDTLDAARESAEMADPARPQRRSRRVRRTDWRLGGRTVIRWREGLLAIALLSLGAGILAASAAQQLGAPAVVAPLLIWAGMIVPVVIAFARSRPAGLLRWRAVDLLWAFGLGVLVRLAQGWLDGLDGSPALFPQLSTVDGQIATGWWFDGLVAPVLIAPPVEELFFRVVVLVSLYTVLRRAAGGVVAGFAAVLVSTGLFVAAHSLSGTASVVDVASIALLGAVCGLLVVLTGRVWSAIGVHVVYNALGVGLALLGTL